MALAPCAVPAEAPEFSPLALTPRSNEGFENQLKDPLPRGRFHEGVFCESGSFTWFPNLRSIWVLMPESSVST